MILYSKEYLQNTLEYYDVNRVMSYDAHSFISQYKNLDQYHTILKSYWSIRSKNKSGGGGVFVHNINYYEALIYLREYRLIRDNLYICESLKKYDDENLICNGEVEVFKKYGIYEYQGWINTEKGLNLREANKGITCKQITNRHHIPTCLFDLIWTKGILNSVIEFSLYDRGVGIKNEDLLIWEIRRY